jgi:hypothetical protein
LLKIAAGPRPTGVMVLFTRGTPTGEAVGATVGADVVG